ncbi:hypothetical protein Syun_000415 [Stephania yunnanensis]|uniref:Cucumisin n=1 Tax=Stephania yunnanensis TaxID=152371 RepID=A0AAP0LD13_9MAGN
MASLQNPCVLSLFITTLCIFFIGNVAEDRKDYIVYMGKLPQLSNYSPLDQHHSILQDVIEEESWDFIGFGEKVERNPKVESDVIVGLIDSGIWPESESFSDEGFGPPPKKWKGVCNGGANFTCNNKIIGARYYTDDENNARDTVGHGSHTASTAAGNLVKQASFFGVAEGNARGAVPLSRIAVYKACSPNGCRTDGILSAFDDAISDGVDILSVSLGSRTTLQLEEDVIAIGAFHAMQRGILTSNSAGNSGPDLATTASIAPWLFSVAASTTSRRIIDKVVLGDNTTLVVSHGSAINGFDLKGRKFPLISGAQASDKGCSVTDARNCIESCLIPSKIKGKILLCENNTTPDVALSLSATGAILSDITQSQGDEPRMSIMPTSLLNIKDGASPDITAPGVNILAAWSTLAPPTSETQDTRSVKYNIISGTSMSCPHVSGAAAYVKTFHPDWSPSAIKSALMTTVVPMNASSVNAELAYGAGFINPVKAINPGLVYDASEDDYLKLLCSIGYTSKTIKLIAGKNSSCPPKYNGTVADLNYPSITMHNSKETKYTRTVTNVGVANSTYRATVASPSYVIVDVEPKVLSFKSLNEKQSFVVTVSLKVPPGEVLLASASLVWSDGIHSVRTPIVVY